MIVKLIIPAMIRYAVTTEMCKGNVVRRVVQKGYELTYDEGVFDINLSTEHFVFKIFDNGVIVFNNNLLLEDSLKYAQVLKIKENKTADIINCNGTLINFLKTFEECIKAEHPYIQESFYFNGKYISYCLATYKLTNKYKATAYSLALKREITEEQIETLNEPSLNVVTISNNLQLLLIWGARIVIGDDEYANKIYNDFLNYENEAQYMWFIITSLDKRIDSYMLNETRRTADIAKLLDASYSVLYRKSRFDGVVSSKSHRYEIEILNNIIASSKIDKLYDNLEKKIKLLKEKSSLVEEKMNKENRKFVNALLGIISFLSSISTLYAFVSVFQTGNEKTTYIIITVVAAFIMCLASFLQYLGKKRRNAKNKKQDKS